jgi:hypothetical protein
MCCTSEDVKRSVEGFKKDIGDKKTKYLDSVKSEDAIKYAFDNAYGDAKRTLTGIRDFQKEKETAKGRIVEKMLDYFNGPAPSGQEAFDVLHEEMCMLWCIQFTESRKDLGTYGKAQKIINMSFKYLFCCEDAKEHYAHFQYCHMPLDSFTLEWIKRFVKDEKKNALRVGKIDSWSKMQNADTEYYIDTNDKEFYPYDRYVKWIRDYIHDRKWSISPLELEFIIWPIMQKKLAAEGFLIGLQENPDRKAKQEIQEKSLEDNYREICAALKKIDRCDFDISSIILQATTE